ncbi:MAG TPA: hypothetical protein DD420_30360, partial [Streptomyces sp.]|nr:hypothetical protein [Streptomyces sp.]
AGAPACGGSRDAVGERPRGGLDVSPPRGAEAAVRPVPQSPYFSRASLTFDAGISPRRASW